MVKFEHKEAKTEPCQIVKSDALSPFDPVISANYESNRSVSSKAADTTTPSAIFSLLGQEAFKSCGKTNMQTHSDEEDDNDRKSKKSKCYAF